MSYERQGSLCPSHPQQRWMLSVTASVSAPSPLAQYWRKFVMGFFLMIYLENYWMSDLLLLLGLLWIVLIWFVLSAVMKKDHSVNSSVKCTEAQNIRWSLMCRLYFVLFYFIFRCVFYLFLQIRHIYCYNNKLALWHCQGSTNTNKTSSVCIFKVK